MIFNTTSTLKAFVFSAFMAMGASALPMAAMADASSEHGHTGSNTEVTSSDNEYIYDDQGIKYEGRYVPMIGQFHTISLIRQPYLSDEQLILRISGPEALGGCIEATNFGFEASYTEHYLDITLKPSIFDMRDQPQYAHFECNVLPKLPVADIVMDKQTLIDNGTKTIRFHVQNETNYYNVDVRDDRILILPDSTDVTVNKVFRPHELPMRKSSTIYWFYPMNSLVVWTPQIIEPEKAQEYITKFAKQNGLIPMDEYYESFKSPLYDKKFMYFVDTAGKFTATEGLENGAQIGDITVETVKYGLHGDEPATEEIMIFARKPGLYD